MAKVISPEATKLPILLKWDDYRRGIKWESQGGSHLGKYPDIEGDSYRARMVMVPVAQGSGAFTSPEETVYIGVEGEVEVSLGSERHLLKPNDLLFVTANAAISYKNVGLDTALICEIVSKSHNEANAGAEVSTTTKFMDWEDVRREFHWNLPYAETWGYHRGSGPHILTTKFRGHMVRQPPAQGCPWHATTRDIFVLQLKGEIEWTAAGQKWPLIPRDLFIMRPGIPYVYTNLGMSEAIFFDIGGPVPKNSGGTVYWKSDPGWPVRPDAELLPTELGPEGERRVKH
jgi:quercetin dioxygenase-like cupin family protein